MYEEGKGRKMYCEGGMCGKVCPWTKKGERDSQYHINMYDIKTGEEEVMETKKKNVCQERGKEETLMESKGWTARSERRKEVRS